MPRLIILGTASAVPDEKHENTHMALIGQDRTILIDCVNNPIVRLKQAGLPVDQLTDLILTHFHPDHVSGVPSLLMNSWLLGRQQPLRIFGLQFTLERVQQLMEMYDWKSWPRFFPVEFCPVPEAELVPVLDGGEFRIKASPVHHMVPTIGLRVEFLSAGKVLAYSCDTEPCLEVVRLADGADVLIHEATGEGFGHSSPKQAGEIANRAEVGRLILIHYPPEMAEEDSWVAEARSNFHGPVSLAQDFLQLDF